MWNLSPPPGFQGLREDLPFTCYQRHLPHWRQDGATYFVTFRLADSLPQSKLLEIKAVRREWELKKGEGRELNAADELTRQIIQATERWLDQGMGSCVLGRENISKLVVDAMHFFDLTSSAESEQPIGQNNRLSRFELDAYVVMPNHVHAILRPLQPSRYPLDNIVGSWKQHSARQINALMPMSGEIWQEESFDRIIRDEEHLWRVIQYIGRNPQLAGLSSRVPVWIRPEWKKLRGTFVNNA